MNNISTHVTYAEATDSKSAARLGIDNTPDDGTLIRMRAASQALFEPTREHVLYGKPLGINSFYRCPALNAAIGGAKNSQHTKGEAIDIDADVYGGAENRHVFAYIRANLEFDQLIWEFGDERNPAWVHASYVLGQNRKQVLRSIKVDGETRYIPFDL